MGIHLIETVIGRVPLITQQLKTDGDVNCSGNRHFIGSLVCNAELQLTRLELSARPPFYCIDSGSLGVVDCDDC